jgi:hypothetical protein
MQIRIGYELSYECPPPTPMILTLHVHFSRVSDVVIPDHMHTDPPVPISAYRDSFGRTPGRTLHLLPALLLAQVFGKGSRVAPAGFDSSTP